MIPIQRVMVPIDFSKESTLAAKFAASLAQEYHAKLYVIHVLDPLPLNLKAYYPDLADVTKKRDEQAAKDLEKVIPQAVREKADVEFLLETGTPTYDIIAQRAKELDIDVIVISTHGRSGLGHILLGSVAEKVIRHAPCPVFVIRNPKDKYVYGWE